MASKHKKSNGGRKTMVNNTKVSPRHLSTTNDNRAASTSAKTAPPKNAGRLPTTTSAVERKPTEITRQQIAEAAYLLWQKRGGSEVHNWLEAERQLRSGLAVR